MSSHHSIPPPAPKKNTKRNTLDDIFNHNNKVKKCLFKFPIKKETTTPKFWISKCPQDMLDKWERF